MTLTVAFKEGVRFDVTSGGHTVITDQPVEDGGRDEGMSPVDLFVGSIASCVGYFVRRYCERHQIPAEGLRVEADWSMAERPHRVGAVGPDLSYVGDVRPERAWHLRHFRDPQAVSPGSIMPKFPLTDVELNDLASYMLSLKEGNKRGEGVPSVVSHSPVLVLEF